MTSGRQTVDNERLADRCPVRWGRGTDGYVRSGQPTAGRSSAVSLPLHVRSSKVSLPLYVHSGLPTATWPQRSLTAAQHTSGAHMGGKDSVALLRRRPIIRGLVRRLAKSLHHHHVLLVRHPTVAHHVRRRRRRLFARQRLPTPHQVGETGTSVWTRREPKPSESGQKRYAQTVHSVTPSPTPKTKR